VCRVFVLRAPQHRGNVVPHHEDPPMDRDVVECGGVGLDLKGWCAQLGVMDGDWRVHYQHLRVAPVKGCLPRGHGCTHHDWVGVFVEGVADWA